jgi:hypothetical protein
MLHCISVCPWTWRAYEWHMINQIQFTNMQFMQYTHYELPLQVGWLFDKEISQFFYWQFLTSNSVICDLLLDQYQSIWGYRCHKLWVKYWLLLWSPHTRLNICGQMVVCKFMCSDEYHELAGTDTNTSHTYIYSLKQFATICNFIANNHITDFFSCIINAMH